LVGEAIGLTALCLLDESQNEVWTSTEACTTISAVLTLLDGLTCLYSVGYCEHSSKTAIAMLNLYKLAIATGFQPDLATTPGADATIGVQLSGDVNSLHTSPAPAIASQGTLWAKCNLLKTMWLV